MMSVDCMPTCWPSAVCTTCTSSVRLASTSLVVGGSVVAAAAAVLVVVVGVGVEGGSVEGGSVEVWGVRGPHGLLGGTGG